MHSNIHTRHIACSTGPHRLPLLSLLSLYRSRRALRHLDQTRLQDLGLSQLEAESEANRPFWDIPQHWREKNC